MAMAALFAAGVGTSLMAGMAQYQQGQFAKTMASRQSEALELQAKQVQQQAGADIAMQDYKAAHIAGSMAARTGASGVTEEGSPSMMLHTSADEARLNDIYTKYAANIQSNNLYYQGQIGKVEGEQEADAATIGAITSGATGAISSGISAYGLSQKITPYTSSYSPFTIR